MTTLVYGGTSPLNPAFQVTRSIRLRSSASASFTRTPAAAGNRQTWTYSAWHKRGLLPGALNTLLSGFSGANTDVLCFDASNRICFFSANGAIFNRVSTSVYRDIGAWYHIVLVSNTTSVTAQNRLRIYINGVEITAWDTNTTITQNTNWFINNNTLQTIGSNNNASQYTDGYLAEINFIDGQALTPTAFGSYNTVTGVWQPIMYSGTYGTNGYYLNFRNNSASTANFIGADSSGNGNNWTPTGINTVSVSTNYDSMIDVPGIPTGVASNYPTLNPLASANVTSTYSNANLTFISGIGAQWRGAVATQFINSGRFYFEATITILDQTNYTMIGACGIQTNTSLFANYTGFVSNGWSVQSTGSGGAKYNSGSSVNVTNAAFTAFALNDVLQCAVDVTNGRIWFGKNNVWLEGDPAAGTGASYTTLTGPIAPSISCFNSAQLSANFGQRPFSYTPPSGFSAVNAFNIPPPSVPNGATQMAATLYTGNGATQSVNNTVNNISFQPNLVWIKSRSTVDNNILQDSVRGATNRIFSNTNEAQSTSATSLTSFNSNGFTVGVDSNVNGSGLSLVGWQWKESPSSGFDIVLQTLSTTGINTINHNLGVVPNMVIVKRTNGAENWLVYHSSVTTQSQYLVLNTTAAVASATNLWGSSPFTSSQIFLDGTSGNTYVFYIFANTAGYSRFGSYIGNGTADGPFVYTGFRPRWVLVKASTTSDWTVADTSRSPINLSTATLLPNGNSAETTALQIDILSNGFKLRSTSLNTSTVSYMYAAFAENPFQYALAR
jgi:hypothetical protein